jgi:NADPH:quinone reductase-like Zn-dependent oxidoreductase
MFRALVTDNAGGTVTAAVQELDEAALPAGDVRVAVQYSSLNYKDGLVVGGAGGLVKKYPHVPGIDLAGTVVESRDARLEARRQGAADGLARRRTALGRICAARAGQRGLAGAAARRARCAPGDGHRHGRASRRCSQSWRSKRRALPPTPAKCS